MAVGDNIPDLKTQFAFVQGKPATEDVAGFAAVGTYVNVSGVKTLPEMGDTAEDMNEGTLDDGRVKHLWGVVDGGVGDVPVQHREGDAGQAALIANQGSNTTFSFKITEPDGTIIYKYGIIGPVRRSEKTTTSFKGYIVPIAFNSAEVYA